MEQIKDWFSEVEDKRHSGYTKHKLSDVLVMIMCGVLWGQKAIHEKTNEIPVFQEMPDFLNVSGKTITADAMHGQKETCNRIVASGGKYIFGLKENHKSLYDDVALFLGSEHEGIECYQSSEKNGGRIEKRIYRKICDISWLEGREQWAGLQSAFSVRRIITAKDKTTDETCYYITSLDTTPQELLRITRAHWKIESLHWLPDVTFSEDNCAILSENGQKTLNALRKPALFLHKQFLANQPKKSSIKVGFFSCLLIDHRLCETLGSL